MKTKQIELPFSKVINPATYEQVEKLRSFDGFICSESNSQLMKRLDSEKADNAIEQLSKGINIEVK
jgi:hypothetical protein